MFLTARPLPPHRIGFLSPLSRFVIFRSLSLRSQQQQLVPSRPPLFPPHSFSRASRPTMRPDGPRDPVTGPDGGPESPYPIRLAGPVIKGFGRGSKELGIPTANIPAEGLAAYPDLQVGVYYGVVALDPARFAYEDASSPIRPAVLSIGYNPFYKNQTRSIEIHIMPSLSAPSPTADGGPTKFHKLPDFYGTDLRLLILGYIRPEYDYVSLEALVEDIRLDCEVARRSLQRPAYACYLAGEECAEDVREARQWLTRFESQ